MAAATSKSRKKAPAKKAAPVKFVAPEVEEGSWQDTIVKSAILKDRAEKGSTKAGELLWSGAQEGITDWLPDADEDASGEGLYQTLLTLMGKARKGDASKIKSVAVAVKDNGLVLSSYPNLSKAYAAAQALTVSAPAQAAEDDAAEALTQAISDAAPKSSSTPEGAAKILLGEGVDEFVRLVVAEVIATAGSYEKAEPVLRSLARALSQEIVGNKPKPEPKPKAEPKPKGAAKKAAAAKPKAKDGAAKAKPKPKPVVDETPDDEDDILAEDEAIANGLDSDLDDLLDEADAEDSTETPEVPVKTKAKPVVRRR